MFLIINLLSQDTQYIVYQLASLLNVKEAVQTKCV